MAFNIALLTVSTAGVISNTTNIDSSIIRGFTITHTVGNELYLEAGDLLLKTNDAISWASGINMVKVEWDSILFNIYVWDTNLDSYEKDEKTGYYQYRLRSIQKHFYKLLAETQVADPGTGKWGNAYVGTIKTIEVMTIYMETGSSMAHDRYGFPLGSLLDGLEGKHNNYYFVIGIVTHPCILPPNENCLMLWRGKGTLHSETEFIAARDTFDYNDDGHDYFDFTVVKIGLVPNETCSCTHNSASYYWESNDLDYVDTWKFYVSGVSTFPSQNDIYSHNSAQFTVDSIYNGGGGSGWIKATRTSGDNDPNNSGTLTRVSGSGDASITFNSIIHCQSGTVTFKRHFDHDVHDPLPSGTLTCTGTCDDPMTFTAVSQQEKETSYYYITWDFIFKLTSILYNAFICATPRIQSNTLYLDIEFRPRIEVTPSGQISDSYITWINRKKISHNFNIDGVEISLVNYTYEQGDIEEGKNVYSKSIDIGCKRNLNDDWLTTLYIGLFEVSGASEDYKNPISPFYNPGYDPFIEDYYENLIGAGDGYEGKIKIDYNDGSAKVVKLLDYLQFDSGSTDIMLTEINSDEKGYAQIKGIKV